MSDTHLMVSAFRRFGRRFFGQMIKRQRWILVLGLGTLGFEILNGDPLTPGELWMVRGTTILGTVVLVGAVFVLSGLRKSVKENPQPLPLSAAKVESKTVHPIQPTTKGRAGPGIIGVR